MLPPCSPPQDQYTPLHEAARNNSVDAAKVLIDRGAQVDARSKVSLNPNTRRKSPGHVAAGPWGCACICVFAEADGVLKKRKKEKKSRFCEKSARFRV